MARTIAAVGCRAFEPIVVPIAFPASFAPTTNRNHTAARAPTLATNAAVPFIATGENVVTPCLTNNESSRNEDFWVQTHQRIYRKGKGSRRTTLVYQGKPTILWEYIIGNQQ
jgi:hypothetical protein